MGRPRTALAGIALVVLGLPGAHCASAQPLPAIVDDPRLAAAVALARERFLARQPFDRLDVTVLAADGKGAWRRGAWHGDRLALPASCVKLAFLAGAIAHCTERGRPVDCLDPQVRPMVVVSDNVATGFVVDAITGAPNVPSAAAERVPLPRDARDRPSADGVEIPSDFAAWLDRRRYTERLLADAGVLDGQTLLNKTWPTNSGEVPAGYERLSLALAGRNAMSPDGAARLMLALRTGALVPEGRDYAFGLLARERWGGHAAFGGGLPPGTRYAAKTGTAYDTLQEIAWFALPDGREFVVAAFSNGWHADEPPPWDVAPLGGYAEELLAALAPPRRAAPWSAHLPAAPGAGLGGSRLPARGAWRGGTAWVDARAGASHTWRVRVPRAGRYELAVWYAGGPDRTAAARYVVDAREVPVHFDQRHWGARWLPLGQVDLRGRELAVHVRADAPGVLEPGTLRVTAVPATRPRPPWTGPASPAVRGTARTDPARPRGP